MEFSGRNDPPPNSEEIHLGFRVNEEHEVTKGLEEQEMLSVPGFLSEREDNAWKMKTRRQQILRTCPDIIPGILFSLG